MKLRVVFFGSPTFAVPSLEALAAAQDVVAVVTQPDKPAGRGRKLAPPPVKELAARLDIPVLQPRSVKTDEFLATFRDLHPDVAAIVAYGKIVPQAVLDVPAHGFLNVHASLLPCYRGAAPIQWALIRGETTTGVTIMRLDAGLDTGPLLLARTLAVREEDTAGTLSNRLAAAGAELMMVALGRLETGSLVETPQDSSQATLAPPLEKDNGHLDFSQPAAEVRNLARGVDPWPGAFALLGGQPLRLWGARLASGGGSPGSVLGVDRDGLIVACGSGAVAFTEAQLPGRRRMPVQALVAGHPIPPGTLLG